MDSNLDDNLFPDWSDSSGSQFNFKRNELYKPSDDKGESDMNSTDTQTTKSSQYALLHPGEHHQHIESTSAPGEMSHERSWSEHKYKETNTSFTMKSLSRSYDPPLHFDLLPQEELLLTANTSIWATSDAKSQKEITDIHQIEYIKPTIDQPVESIVSQPSSDTRESSPLDDIQKVIYDQKIQSETITKKSIQSKTYESIDVNETLDWEFSHKLYFTDTQNIQSSPDWGIIEPLFIASENDDEFGSFVTANDQEFKQLHVEPPPSFSPVKGSERLAGRCVAASLQAKKQLSDMMKQRMSTAKTVGTVPIMAVKDPTKIETSTFKPSTSSKPLEPTPLHRHSVKSPTEIRKDINEKIENDIKPIVNTGSILPMLEQLTKPKPSLQVPLQPKQARKESLLDQTNKDEDFGEWTTADSNQKISDFSDISILKPKQKHEQ